ncbi:hypothetical protein Tco_1474048 [Tanacetum coccineum]
MSNTNTNLPSQTSSVLQNDTVSSCSISKVQEKTQLSRIKCMNSLRATQSQLKFLIDTLQDFGTVHIFKRTFSQDLDLLEQHLTKEIISQTDYKTTLTKLRTTNLETASANQSRTATCFETKDVHAIKYKMSKTKERCMAYFRSLHSHLQVLPKEDLKGTRIEHGFKRAFMSLLVKRMRLSQYAFLTFQKFIDLKFTLDYDSQMSNKYFVEYTGIEVKHFKDTLLQHMGNVKKFVAERTTSLKSMIEGKQWKDQQCKMSIARQQHTEQPKIINEGRVDQYPEQCQVKSHMLNSSPDNQTTDYSKQSIQV